MIRLKSENNTALREAANEFGLLQAQQAKDEEEQARHQEARPKHLAERREMCRLLGVQLQRLVRDNHHHHHTDESKEQVDMQERVSAREQRKQKRHARSKSRVGVAIDVDVDPNDIVELQPLSEQDLAFQERVDANRRIEDELLGQINAGLDELAQLANEAQRQLVVQKEMIGAVDHKMGGIIVQFKSANRRLKDMLSESGGCSRWCPLLTLLVFILALVGYLLHIV